MAKKNQHYSHNRCILNGIFILHYTNIQTIVLPLKRTNKSLLVTFIISLSLSINVYNCLDPDSLVCQSRLVYFFDQHKFLLVIRLYASHEKYQATENEKHSTLKKSFFVIYSAYRCFKNQKNWRPSRLT